MSLYEIIKKGLDLSGLNLSQKKIESLVFFSIEFKKWGSRMNLSALINNDEAMVEELFIDSLAPTVFFKNNSVKNSSLIDIGSGGGFPGIPLKIANPSINMALTDSKTKKVYFMNHVIRCLSLEGIYAKKVRFAEKGINPDMETKFDWAIAKAVADTDTLSVWAAHVLRTEGKLIVMKGIKEGVGKSYKNYSGPEKRSYFLPFSGIERNLYIYTKLQ